MKQEDLFAGPARERPAGRDLKRVTLITDGACHGNPGPGGWACILRHERHTKELSGSELHTTNNRMELAAVLHGLRSLREPCRVTVITDSEYVRKGITTWIYGWKRRGWKTATKTPVLNQDLWKAIDEEAHKHEVEWEWVKGHADHADNNRADELATEAALRARLRA